MVNLVAKATTQTLAPGSERQRLPGAMRGEQATRFAHGFTLIELLLVVALIAVASGLATLALRDPAATRLDHEAARLSVLLEAARAEARALGLPVTWQPLSKDGAGAEERDFRFLGLPSTYPLPTQWLAPGVVAQVVGAPALVLGPEPIIGAQRVVLSLENQRAALATDGLGPFVAVAEGDLGTPP